MRGRAWRGGRQCKKNLVEINVGIGTVHVEIRSAVAGHCRRPPAPWSGGCAMLAYPV